MPSFVYFQNLGYIPSAWWFCSAPDLLPIAASTRALVGQVGSNPFSTAWQTAWLTGDGGNVSSCIHAFFIGRPAVVVQWRWCVVLMGVCGGACWLWCWCYSGLDTEKRQKRSRTTTTTLRTSSNPSSSLKHPRPYQVIPDHDH